MEPIEKVLLLLCLVYSITMPTSPPAISAVYVGALYVDQGGGGEEIAVGSIRDKE